MLLGGHNIIDLTKRLHSENGNVSDAYEVKVLSVERISLCLSSCFQLTIQKLTINYKCLTNNSGWLLASSYTLN